MEEVEDENEDEDEDEDRPALVSNTLELEPNWSARKGERRTIAETTTQRGKFIACVGLLVHGKKKKL